jgi:glycosyltransferase involved in cell wall biosynthesis
MNPRRTPYQASHEAPHQAAHPEGATAAGMPAPGSVAVTVLVAARDEQANIARCVASAAPARRIVVVDSGSADGTAAIAEAAGAEVHQFRFEPGKPKKRQWALDTLAFDTDWVLLLDADEQVPPALWKEITAVLAGPPAHQAYFIRKGFHFLGRRFRCGGFSFDAVLLIDRHRARFERLSYDADDRLDMEVHERVIVDGSIGRLATPVIHDDFKSLEAYVARHNAYSTWEARMRHRFLETGRWGQERVRARLFGNAQERRRFLKYVAVRTPCEPVLWFLYHYLFRGGFLEGRRGFIASRIRANYIADVRAKVYELSLPRRVG